MMDQHHYARRARKPFLDRIFGQSPIVGQLVSESRWRYAFVLATLVGFTTWMPDHCLAGGGAENVILVVNADSATSMLIANHYIAGRRIPARNVVYLNDVPDAHWTGVELFRTRILRPIFQQITERKLDNCIDYIVYSADFPTTIDISPDLAKLKDSFSAKDPPQALPANIYAPHASITSMTYFATAVLENDPSYILLDANSYYRQPAQAILQRPFSGELQKEFENNVEAFKNKSSPAFDAAIESLESMAAKNPRQIALLYWLARFHASKGSAERSCQWLTKAIQMGWSFRKQTESDPAFNSIRGNPDFTVLLTRIPLEPFDLVPTSGFKSSYLWGANGMLNNVPDQGKRYYLSTMLAVARFQGNTEQEALQQLRVSMQADETHPSGTFYFSDTADIRNTIRKEGYSVAMETLRRLGQPAELISTPLPENKDDVLGITTGTPQFDWKASGSRFRPGAIGDNLTSYGGAMASTMQTKLTEFLRNDAAGASGTVEEPYAIQAKFPHPMIHAHYARGCSLAESFYQSVAGPYQLLIVGDALCQPFAIRPILKVSGLSSKDPLTGTIDVRLDGNQSHVLIAGIELYVDGVLVMRDRLRDKIGFDTTGLSDGYHEIRFVAISSNPIESTNSVILPVIVNNLGLSIELTSSRRTYKETDTITFNAKSNHGNSIELTHNMRSLATEKGRDGKFKIPADLLGRGPVKLVALGLDSTGKAVASLPLELEIVGKWSDQ